MKAQRRHELKTNTLAQGLEGLPGILRQYGDKLLLVVVLILLAIVVIRYYTTGKRQRVEQTQISLNTARTAVRNLSNVPLQTARPELAAATRDTLAKQAQEAIDDVLDHTEDPALQTRALIVRGDLNWTLAMLPDPPGAETQPALKYGRSREESLRSAQQAYQEILSGKTGAPADAVRGARFGLAAVAENQGDWDEAARSFTAIINDPATAEAFKQQAQGQLARLERLRQPALLGAPRTAPSTQAATEPAAAGATQPATLSSPPAATAPTQSTAPGR